MANRPVPYDEKTSELTFNLIKERTRLTIAGDSRFAKDSTKPEEGHAKENATAFLPINACSSFSLYSPKSETSRSRHKNSPQALSLSAPTIYDYLEIDYIK